MAGGCHRALHICCHRREIARRAAAAASPVFLRPKVEDIAAEVYFVAVQPLLRIVYVLCQIEISPLHLVVLHLSYLGHQRIQGAT
jgi:hypothetical protein